MSGALVLRKLAMLVCFTTIFSRATSAEFKEAKVPRAGTWRMIGKEKDVTIAFLPGEGARSVGYLDWSSPGRPSHIEIMAGTLNPKTRIIRFCGRETQTQTEEIPLVYHGVLSADGRQITKFRAINIASAEYDLEWVTDERTKLPQVTEAALQLDSERSLIRQQASNQYYRLTDRAFVQHSVDDVALEGLSKSANPRIRAIALARLDVMNLHVKVGEMTANGVASKEYQQIRDSLWLAAAQAMRDDEEGSLHATGSVALGENSPFAARTNRQAAITELATVNLATLNRISKLLQEDFRLEYPRLAKLSPESFAADFRLSSVKGVDPVRPRLNPDRFVAMPTSDTNSYGVIAMKNDTGRDLHDCLVVTRMSVDQGMLTAYEKKMPLADSQFLLLASLVGMDLKSVTAAQQAAVTYVKLGKGSTCCVPLWLKGQEIQFKVTDHKVIELTAGAIEVWVGAAEGEATCQLDMDQVRSVLPKPTSKKSATKRQK